MTAAGAAATAGFQSPAGIVVSGGFAYVGGHDAISKVNLTTGQTTILAGQPGVTGCADGASGSATTFTDIFDLTTDGTYLYSAVWNCTAVRRTSLLTGATTTLAKTTSTGSDRPRTVSMGSDGMLYWSDYSTVFRMDPATTTYTSFVGLANSTYIYGMSVDSTDVWVNTVIASKSALVRVSLTSATQTTVVPDTGLALGNITAVGNYIYGGAVAPKGGGAPLLRRYAKADGSFVDLAGAANGFQDGTGTDAWFSSVSGVASDGTSLYVADSSNSRVRTVHETAPLPAAQPSPVNSARPVLYGQVSTLSGSGSASSSPGSASTAGYSAPLGLVVVKGFAYVAGNDIMAKVDLATGNSTILAGQIGSNGTCQDSTNPANVRFSQMFDLTTDGTYLYSTSWDCNAVMRTSLATGATSTMAIMGSSGSDRPRTLTFAGDKNLYWSDYSTIFKMNPVTNSYSSYLVLPSAQYIYGMASDASNLYVATLTTSSPATPIILKINLATGVQSTLLTDSSMWSNPTFGGYRVQNISVAGGYVYYGEYLPSTGGQVLIAASTTDGTMSAVAGQGGGYADGIGSHAAFATIGAAASDGSNLYVADTWNYRIRAVAAIKPPTANGGPTLPGEQTGGGSGAENSCAKCIGDPVDTATGALLEHGNDLAVPGRGPALSWGRSYDSLSAGQLGPLGYGWTAGYGTNLRVDPNLGTAPLASSPYVNLVEDNGATLTFARQTDGSYKAAPRVLATLVQRTDGSWVFTRRGQTTYTFNPSGQLTAITDLNGYSSSVAYNTNGQLTTVTDPAGRQLAFTYATTGLISLVGDSAGRQVSYGYDTAKNLTSVTGPNGAAWTFGYDAAHHLTSVTDPNGHATSNSYDRNGRVVSQIDPLNHTTTFSYNAPVGASDLTTTMTDPRGYATQHTYRDGELVGVVNAVGTAVEASWQYGYDQTSLGKSSITDPLGHTWTRTYDAAGNELSSADPLGNVRSATFNSLNEPLTTTDPNGVTTTNSYDSAGNLLSTSTPLVGSSPAVSATTTNTYGDPTHPGDITSTTDPRGKVWQRSFDAFGQLSSATDPLGHRSTSTYACTPAGPGCRSNIGWVYATTAPKGNVSGGIPSDYTTTVTRDDAGRILSVTNPLGKISQYQYDGVGNKIKATDANSHVTSYTYDVANELTITTRADSTTLLTSYDPDGNALTQTDGAGHVTAYSYDPLNRVATTTDPLNRTTRNAYDAAGRLTTRTDPTNRVTTFGYDNANRRISTSYVGTTTPNVTVGYDPAGRRTSMTDGSGTSTFALDSLGRLTSTRNGAGKTISYGYDLAGQQTSLTYPNGKTITRAFDDTGHLVGITDWLSHPTVFTPDANGNTATVTSGNGIVTSNTLDRADRLMGISHQVGASTLASFGYTRDDIGLLTSDTPTGIGTPETYGHDTLNRLTGRNSSNYTYDTADNLTGLTDGSTQRFDVGNQITASQAPTTLVGTGSAQDNGTGSTLSAPLPANRIGGDVVLLSVVTSTGQTVSTPSGYTARGSYAPAGNQTKITTFSRAVLAGDAGPITITFGTGATAKAVLAAVYRGVAAATPIEASSTSSTTTTNSLTLPSITSLSDNARLVLLAGEVGNAAAQSWTRPAGMTDQVHVTNQTLVSTALFDQPLNAAGSTGSRTTAVSLPGSLVGVLWALKPLTPTTYAYDGVGNRTSRNDPLGGTATYGYDQESRLISLNGTAATYTYDGTGLRTSKTVAGATTAFTWDLSGGLPQLLDDGTTSYLYGPAGNVIEQIQNNAAITVVGTGSGEDGGTGSSLTVNLPAGIQARDQILLAVTANTAQTVNTPSGYTLVQSAAATGNTSHTIVFRKAATTGESSATVTFGTGVTPKSVLAVAYRGVDSTSPIDVSTTATAASTNKLPLGSLTTNAANERLVLLAGATANTSTATWTAPTGMTDQVHASTQPLISTLIADQTLSTASATGGRTATLASNGDLTGVLLALKPAPASYYYQADQLGSTRLITDQYGTAVATYSYDPYGQTTTHTGYLDTPFQYAGQYHDTETGLYYLRARYYDPATAQFLTRDPLEAETGAPYSYAGNDPVDNSDPSGMDWCVGDWCLGFHPSRAINPIVNIGRGASFGLSDRIANWISPGASCTVSQNAGDQLLGQAATIVATYGLGAAGETQGPPDEAPYGSTPNGRPFTKHYGTQTGPDRNIPGSVVDQTIDDYPGVPGRNGTTVHYDPDNDVTVVTGRGGGIVSARRGAP